MSVCDRVGLWLLHYKYWDATGTEKVNSLVCLAGGEPCHHGRVQKARVVEPFGCCWCSAHVFSAIGESLTSRLLNENNQKYTPGQSPPVMADNRYKMCIPSWNNG